MKKTDTLNLLICGAQRSGTTSLKHYLEEHPEISFLGENDLYYEGKYVSYPFCTPFYSKASIGEDRDVYREISKKHGGRVAYIGTKWPYFMLFPHIACNIRLHLPGAKLLFILRNPVDALYSSYWHSKSKNDSPYSFDERVERAQSGADAFWTPQNRGQWPKLLAGTDNEEIPDSRGNFVFTGIPVGSIVFVWAVVDGKTFFPVHGECTDVWCDNPTLMIEQKTKAVTSFVV